LIGVNSHCGATGLARRDLSDTAPAGKAAHEGNMEDIERISVEEAHRKVKANQALLVCAYEDEAKCRMVNLDGSISLTSFQKKAASLPKSEEIIFFCA
jgi:hypothetical protein